jgi:hypothetical protein
MNNEKKKEKNLKKLIESLVEKELNEGAFLDPLSDIVKTATYGAKKLGHTIGTHTLKTIGQLSVVLRPWISNKEIDRISKDSVKEKKELISKLDNEYKDVLARNKEFLTNSDVAVATMLLNPGLFIATKAGLSGLESSLAFLSLITAPSPSLRSKVNNIKSKIHNVNKTNYPKGSSGLSSGGGYGYSGDDSFGDFGGLYEAIDSSFPKVIDNMLQDVLKDPELQTLIKKNNRIKSLDRIPVQIIANRFYALEKINSLNELKIFLGNEEYNEISKNIKNIEKLDEKFVIKEIKNIFKSIFIEKLNKLRENSSIENEIDNLIQKIK